MPIDWFSLLSMLWISYELVTQLVVQQSTRRCHRFFVQSTRSPQQIEPMRFEHKRSFTPHPMRHGMPYGAGSGVKESLTGREAVM